jgi:hypothetical protein
MKKSRMAKVPRRMLIVGALSHNVLGYRFVMHED